MSRRRVVGQLSEAEARRVFIAVISASCPSYSCPRADWFEKQESPRSRISRLFERYVHCRCNHGAVMAHVCNDACVSLCMHREYTGYVSSLAMSWDRARGRSAGRSRGVFNCVCSGRDGQSWWNERARRAAQPHELGQTWDKPPRTGDMNVDGGSRRRGRCGIAACVTFCKIRPIPRERSGRRFRCAAKAEAIRRRFMPDASERTRACEYAPKAISDRLTARLSLFCARTRAVLLIAAIRMRARSAFNARPTVCVCVADYGTVDSSADNKCLAKFYSINLRTLTDSRSCPR